MTQVPIAERLFTWPADQPRLIGSRCSVCDNVTFPVSSGCPRCGSDQLADVQLSSHGTLWTWTSQGFLPKAPYSGPETDTTFVPWGVGSVELDEDIRIEGRLVDCELDQLRIGMPMKVVVVPFGHTPEGNERVTFAFAPDHREDDSHA